ncbi:hypothetical protein AgCh_017428 [Apium graveolens]
MTLISDHTHLNKQEISGLTGISTYWKSEDRYQNLRKNKNINSLPPKSGVKSQSVRFKPQNPCFHCGSLWHSIYAYNEYHSLYYDYYQIKPSLKKVALIPSSVKSDAKSDISSDKQHVSINSDVKSTVNGYRKDILVLDSGCSGHMTGNKALLSEFVEKASP